MTSPPCPHCDEPTDADDRYCAGCGGELPPPPPPELRCGKCGEVRDLEDLYCAACGVKLAEVSAEPRGQESRSGPSPLTRGTAEGSAGGTSTAAPAPPEAEAEAPPAPGKEGGIWKRWAPEKGATGKDGNKNKMPPKKEPAARKDKKKPSPKEPASAKKRPARKTSAKTARKKTPGQPKPAPDPQPVPQETRRISRWWPGSRGGRTAYGAILVAAGLFGFIAGEGNPLGAVITPVLALILLTFWRNVWISWGGGPRRVRQATGGQAPAPTQSPLPPQTEDGAPPTEAGAGAQPPGDPGGVGETESSGGGILEKVLGIAILLGLIALVRAFGPQVLEVLF